MIAVGYLVSEHAVGAGCQNRLSAHDVRTGCHNRLSGQCCQIMMSGLGVNLAVKQYPNPAGDPVPCGLRSPPDDVIIPLFPKNRKARENAVKFTQMKFRLFSPDISR